MKNALKLAAAAAISFAGGYVRGWYAACADIAEVKIHKLSHRRFGDYAAQKLPLWRLHRSSFGSLWD